MAAFLQTNFTFIIYTMSDTEITIVENSQQSEQLSLILKAEIDTQIATARAFPRSIKMFLDKALSIATVSQDVADSCTYSLPRAGKPIDGPSVRLAEIVSSSYGNIRSAARVISNDGKTITAQGICHDLETNASVTVEVKRSILQHVWENDPANPGRRRKTGRMETMSEDMQVVTGNAACAIAFRNAVFKVIPAALVETIYDKVKEVAKGTAETLPTTRAKAVKFFTDQGIKPEQICSVLEVKKIEDIDLDKIGTLRGMVTLIKTNESTLQELFPSDSTISLADLTTLFHAKKHLLSDAEAQNVARIIDTEESKSFAKAKKLLDSK